MKFSLPFLLSLATADLLPGPSGRGGGLVGNPACPTITCVMFCSNGLQKDEKGCDKCSCVRDGGKVATTTNSCKRDANNCCSELGVAFCPEQNSCVSTRNAVIPCKSWGSNPPSTPQATTGGSAIGATTFGGAATTNVKALPTFPSGSTFLSSSTFPSSSSSTFPSSTKTSPQTFASPPAFSSSSTFPVSAGTSPQPAAPNFAPQSSFLSSTFASSQFPATSFLPASSFNLQFAPAQFSNFPLGSFPPTKTTSSAPTPISFFPPQFSNFAPIPSSTFPGQILPSFPLLGVGLQPVVGGSASIPALSPAALTDAPTSECSQVMCAMYCENGFQMDSRGCAMCACAGSSLDVCPSVDCGSRDCQGGFSQDSKGCPTCICLTGSAVAQGPSSPNLDVGSIDALVAMDRPTISLNPCLPAPGPCSASQKCVPSPKQCLQAPCPQYTCVAAGKGKGGKKGKQAPPSS